MIRQSGAPTGSRLKRAMRYIPDTHYGTDGYPEKVVRRLWATNPTAWIGAATVASFAVTRFLQRLPSWKYPALISLAFALGPTLHPSARRRRRSS